MDDRRWAEYELTHRGADGTAADRERVPVLFTARSPPDRREQRSSDGRWDDSSTPTLTSHPLLLRPTSPTIELPGHPTSSEAHPTITATSTRHPITNRRPGVRGPRPTRLRSSSAPGIFSRRPSPIRRSEALEGSHRSAWVTPLSSLQRPAIRFREHGATPCEPMRSSIQFQLDRVPLSNIISVSDIFHTRHARSAIRNWVRKAARQPAVDNRSERTRSTKSRSRSTIGATSRPLPSIHSRTYFVTRGAIRRDRRHSRRYSDANAERNATATLPRFSSA